MVTQDEIYGALIELSNNLKAINSTLQEMKRNNMQDMDVLHRKVENLSSIDVNLTN